MITDDELAAAVAGRSGWQPAGGNAAVYAVPNSSVTVRVQRAVTPTRFDRYVATVLRAGVAQHTMPHHNAARAVAYAEALRPTTSTR